MVCVPSETTQAPSKWIHLLENGVRTIGDYASTEATNMSINDETVYKVHYVFKTNDGVEGTAAGSTTEPDDYKSVPQREIYYDPKDPKLAFLVDELPGGIRVNHLDRTEVKSFPWLLFILPGATVVGNVLAFASLLGKL